MMIGGHTTYDSITKRTTKEEDATGSIIPLVQQQQQQQDHEATRFLIEEEVEAADGRRRLLLLFRRRTIQTRSVAAILVGILVGASVLVALSATDRNGGGGMVAWRSSSSSSSRTDTVVGFDKVATVSVSTALATVTLDDSCATEVPGAGPCCDGGTITSCFQVCDYLLRCDNGYVPELITDDAATQFPETSDYQPHNCHCRGYEDHNGCFCRQARDMISHSVKGAFVGLCDPCLPPPPTPSPTTRTVYDPSSDYCFKDHDNVDKYCWYPTKNFPYPAGQWGVESGRDDCGPKCSKVQIYDPDQDNCFRDDANYDKYCWYGCGGTPNPIGQWTLVTGAAYNDNCGAQCTDVQMLDIGVCP